MNRLIFFLGTILVEFIINMILMIKLNIGDKKSDSLLFAASVLTLGMSLMVGGLLL